MDSAELVKKIKEINALEQEYVQAYEDKRKKHIRTSAVEPKGNHKSRRATSAVKVVSISRRKKVSYLPVLLGLAGAVLIGCGFAFYQSYTPIELTGYTGVSISGFDSKGCATATIDCSGEYHEFLNTVKATLDKTENLTNGDQIHITYSYDEELAKELKLRVDAEETSVTVSGLAAGTVVSYDSLFEHANVVVEGISPEIYVSVENTFEDTYLQNHISYVITDGKDCYENGDTVTIEAVFDEADAILHAYDIQEGENGYTKTIAVEGYPEYFTGAEELTQEMLDEMFADGAKLLTDAKAKEYGLRIFSEAGLMPYWEGKKTFFTWQNPFILSCYFNVVTEEAMPLIATHFNDVKVVYEATLTQPDGIACQAEIVVQYTDIFWNNDGTPDLKLGEGKIISASYRNSNIKKIVSDTDHGNYESTKLVIK